ncbi:hypothetical protein Ssi03_12950 [Sphaerisporangium siamense]|uniref:Uncharacterized protein n=1 Tax=Sphaerisporangium siamense TaxID=795645 RepID=A0A7W7DC36_9ACTN|nr:hypothetical protein [Sphaerisporangium siamense]MBB4702936.1 hypothetical protein [Sphaerisporangium siamense]GII83305.1 hypothetical protein Ssi03_12950 [Sphaerisporangium siamense]
MAGTYRFKMDQGSTVRRPLRWLRNGEPMDLTGATARMEIRTAAGGALLHRLDTTNGGITLGGTAGTILIYIPAAVSSAWTVLQGVYDLEVVFPNEDVTRLLQGNFSVSAEVTTGE